MKQVKKTKKTKKTKKYKIAVFYFIIFFAYLISALLIVIAVSYRMGFEHGVGVLQTAISELSVDKTVSSKEFYKINLFNISVYSDVNDFYRIYEIMNETDVNSINYPELEGIIYYQNKSPDGYHEHISDASCDGSYSIIGRYIELYKCDGDFILRNINVTEEYSEEFILLHELGHYELYNDVDYQQRVADDYAISVLKQSIVSKCAEDNLK